VLPLFLLWPWRRLDRAETGGSATTLALGLGALAVLSTLWGTPTDMPHFIWQWVLLAAWLAGLSWWQAEQGLDLRVLYHVLLVVGLVIGVSLLWVFYASHPWSERLTGWPVAQNPVVVAQTWGVL